MSDVPSVRSKIQIEGARFRSAVSENLIQTMAGSINWILDRDFQGNAFTGSGTFVVPANVTTAYISGIGGGGGGSSGVSGFDPTYPGAGGGGGGGGEYKLMFANLTPGETLTIHVGAHGNGGSGTSGTPYFNAGTMGGASYVTRSDGTLLFYAAGGYGGNYFSAGGTIPYDGTAHNPAGTTGASPIYPWAGAEGGAHGYNGGDAWTGGATGGTGFITAASGGGGGASSPFGKGGNGGQGRSGTPGSAGQSASYYGAGGGGGGGGWAAAGYNGGNGGPGLIEIIYFNAP